MWDNGAAHVPHTQTGNNVNAMLGTHSLAFNKQMPVQVYGANINRA